jgi:endonuclease/exonuclease/phosphatase family metal-dependent hydrolase
MKRFLGAFWAVVLVAAGLVSPSRADQPVRVRVITYNIHHGEGTDGQFDLPRIARVIQQFEPDLVALQEVDVKTARSGGVDQAAELGKLTGMNVAFGKAMDYSGGQYGEAILSRYPLQSTKNYALPFTEGREPRAAISARVRLGESGPEILFVGTHLEHADAALRLRQAQHLARELAAVEGVPALLTGDLNAVPDSPPMRALLRSWADAGADHPAPTCPAAAPTARIDYILFRPADRWRVVEYRVIEEKVASDHRPVAAVLELKSK